MVAQSQKRGALEEGDITGRSLRALRVGGWEKGVAGSWVGLGTTSRQRHGLKNKKHNARSVGACWV